MQGFWFLVSIFKNKEKNGVDRTEEVSLGLVAEFEFDHCAEMVKCPGLQV